MASTTLGRDRASLVTGGALVLIALVAWGDLFLQQSMPMAMTAPPGLAAAGAFVFAWGIMMVAMMLPSAVPMITLYGVVQRNAARTGQQGLSQALFALVYVAVWTAIGVPVYVISLIVASQTGLMGVLPYALAMVLILAGVYQLTPLKRVCLRVCRNPLSFFLRRSRSGYAASFKLAVEHAGYCLGCCWALMVVLVAGGAMALNWVLLIAALVFVEKVLPRGEWSATLAGVALMVMGVGIAVNPDLAMLLPASAMSS